MTQGHLSVLLAQAALTTPQTGSLNNRRFFLTVLEAGHLRPRRQWTQSLAGALPRLAEAALPLCPHMAESELSGSPQIRALITRDQGHTLITSSKPNHPEPHLQCGHTGARASRWGLGATGIYLARQCCAYSDDVHALHSHAVHASGAVSSARWGLPRSGCQMQLWQGHLKAPSSHTGSWLERSTPGLLAYLPLNGLSTWWPWGH